MKLYHVSESLGNKEWFVPRIPENRIEGEDNKIGRICTSNSIGGCLSAVPNGGSRLEEYLHQTNGFIQVFVFDTEKLNLSSEEVILPETLYRNNWVEDAEHTGEHWITVPVKPTESYWLLIGGWEEACVDVYPYEVEQRMIAGEGYEEAYKAVCPDRTYFGHITTIEVTESYRGEIKAGESFTLVYSEDNDAFDKMVQDDLYPAVSGSYFEYEARETIPIRDLWEWLMYN